MAVAFKTFCCQPTFVKASRGGCSRGVGRWWAVAGRPWRGAWRAPPPQPAGRHGRMTFGGLGKRRVVFPSPAHWVVRWGGHYGETESGHRDRWLGWD